MIGHTREVVYLSLLFSTAYGYSQLFGGYYFPFSLSKERVGIIALATLSQLSVDWRRESIDTRKRECCTVVVPLLLFSYLAWKEPFGWKVYGVSLLFFPVAQKIIFDLSGDRFLLIESGPQAAAPFFFKATKEGCAPLYILGSCDFFSIGEYPSSSIREITKCELLLTDLFQKKGSSLFCHLGNVRRIAEAIDEQNWEWFTRFMREKLRYEEKDVHLYLDRLKKLPLQKVCPSLPLLQLLAKNGYPWFCSANCVPPLLDLLSYMVYRYFCARKDNATHSIFSFFQKQGREIVELDDEERLLAIDLDLFLSVDLLHPEVDPTEQADEPETGKEYAGLIGQQEIISFLMEPEDQENRTLLALRNSSWRPKIEAALERNCPTAIVVDYQELGGESGIYQFLQKKGYELEWRGGRA